jgi:PAS domain S-box-containing protein
VVEDTQDIVMGLKDLLEHDGYAVTVAGTCASAIEHVRTQHVNAILLDLTLPDGDGLEVMKAAHSLDPTLPVIIVTANTSTDKTVGSLTRGAFNYLIKPYNKEELRQTLRRAIGVKELAVKVERVQHLLSESEDRFRSLVESATDAIIVANGRGVIISWNRSASVLFEYSNEEAIGQPLTILMPQRYREAHERGLARMASTGKGRVMGSVVELHGLKKDGTEFPIELSLATWRNTDNTYYSGIIRDISERKKAERVLQESQERFRQLAENIVEVFWMTDPAKQQMLYVSSGYEQIWGRSCESLYASPQSWIEAIHPDDRARVIDAATQKQVVGTYDEQYRIVRPDGTIRWICDRAFPIRDSSGIVYRIVGFAEDITDHKHIQDSLRASEERLELVIQGSSDGFWDGKILPGVPWSSPLTPVWWSPRIKAMLGYTDEEFPDVFDSWTSRLHSDDAERVFAALTAHIECHEPYDVEYRLRTKSGEYRWFRTRGQAMWDDSGRFVRMSGSLQCVTDRMRAEEALRRHQQLLQDVINNTTAVIYVKYADGRYLLTNRRFEELFHVTTNQFVGHTDHEIFPRDIADAFRANDVTVLERNTTIEYEEYAPHPDGLHAYISIKFPLCDHTGKPYATCGISTDITERKRIEDELRANDAQARLTLTEAPVGIWDWDLQSDQLFWSPKVDTLLGIAPGSFCGTEREWLALVYPDDREAVLLVKRRALERHRTDVTFNHRVQWPDGTLHRLMWAGHIVRDQRGEAVRMLGTVREEKP